MKWLIILGLILLVIVLIASRYRKQIQMALYVFRMFRKMRRMNNHAEEKQINTKAGINDETLVNCAKCGTWIPQNKAIKLRSGVYYCSSKCLETTAQVS